MPLGQGTAEYALVLVIVAVLVMGVLVVFGDQVGVLFSGTVNDLNGAFGG